MKARGRRVAIITILVVLAVVTVLFVLPPLLAWQRSGEERALSLSNLRRLSDELHLYAQDYDDRLMPPAQRLPGGGWLTWPQKLGGYGALPSTLENPSNPISSAGRTVKNPSGDYAVHTSYALNGRFYDTFAPGPFLLDNLELPGQTALLVEAGPMWSATGRGLYDRPTPHSVARLDYGDMLDRYKGLAPYPSTHNRRIALVAADGHAVTVRVEHYLASDGPHDPLYGRIGGDIYNWNGGHPNGDTDRPPHE